MSAPRRRLPCSSAGILNENVNCASNKHLISSIRPSQKYCKRRAGVSGNTCFVEPAIGNACILLAFLTLRFENWLKSSIFTECESNLLFALPLKPLRNCKFGGSSLPGPPGSWGVRGGEGERLLSTFLLSFLVS